MLADVRRLRQHFPQLAVPAGARVSRAFGLALGVLVFGLVFVSTAVAATGSLSLRVAGLPAGQAPDGALRMPGGQVHSVRVDQLIVAKARVGVYRLTLRDVRIAHRTGPVRIGALAVPARRVVSVRVLPDARAKLVGSYGTIINPGVRSLTSGVVVSVGGSATNPTSIVLRGHRTFGANTILSLSPSPNLPRGLLSHVSRVARRGGNTAVSLRAASPYEVVPEMQFDVPGVVAKASAATGHVASGSAECGGVSGVSPYRQIQNISFSGGWNTLSLFGHNTPIGVQAAVHFTAAAGVNVTGGLGVSCSLSASVSASGMAGPIPVTAAIEGQLSAFAGVGGVLNAGGSVHVDAGALTVGLPPTLLWVPSVSFSNPKFTLTTQKFAKASASIGVAAKVGIGNDYVASATIDLGSSVDFSAQPGSCTWDARFGQFSAEGKLLGWNIQSPKTPPLFTEQLWHSACRETPSPPGTNCTGSGSRHLGLSASDLSATWSGAGADGGVNHFVGGPSPFANAHIPTLAWRCFLPGRIASAISISGGHVFFVALSSPSTPEQYVLYALDESTGAVQWTRNVAASGGNFGFADLVVAGGAAVVTTEDMTYAYDMSSGQLRWRARLGVGGQVGGSAVVSDGTRIYLQTRAPSQYANPGGTISAMDASSGAIVWQTGYGGYQSGLAVSSGFVFSNNGGALLALNAATGEHAWQTAFNGYSCQWATPMALNGQVFAQISPNHGYPGAVASLDTQTGAVQWTVNTYGAAHLAGAAPGYLLISPGFLGQATVLSSADGHSFWTGATGAGFTATDAFIGSGGRGIRAFDPATGRLKTELPAANLGFTAVAGSVIVGNSGGQEVDAWQ